MAEMLSDADIDVITRFFTSEACVRLFDRLELGLTSDWVNARTPEEREECHRKLHVVLQLKNELRSAPALKRQDARVQLMRRPVQ